MLTLGKNCVRHSRRFARVIEKVKRCEGDIFGILAQHGKGFRADSLRGAPFGRANSKPAQRLLASPPNDFFGYFGTGAKDAVHGFSVRRQNRSVAEGDVDLLAGEFSYQIEFHVLRPSRPTGVPDSFQHRPNNVPNLIPSFAPGSSQSPRTLCLRQPWQIRVVIQEGELRPPPQENWKPRRKAQGHSRPQVLGPGLRTAEVRAGPVELSHATSHLAIAGKYATEVDDLIFHNAVYSPVLAVSRF